MEGTNKSADIFNDCVSFRDFVLVMSHDITILISDYLSIARLLVSSTQQQRKSLTLSLDLCISIGQTKHQN